jgi:hypothetical protein
MALEYYFDTELENTLIATFKQGWTWEDYTDIINRLADDSTNDAIPPESRVDQIIDLRNALKLPDDGIGLIKIRQSRRITDKDIPRSGGITIFVGNLLWITLFLYTIGVTTREDTVKDRIFPTIEHARDYLIQHRATSSG